MTRNLKHIMRITGHEAERVIPELVNRYGQREAALRLGVSQAWIHLWLKKEGYKKKIVWAKDHE